MATPGGDAPSQAPSGRSIGTEEVLCATLNALAMNPTSLAALVKSGAPGGDAADDAVALVPSTPLQARVFQQFFGNAARPASGWSHPFDLLMRVSQTGMRALALTLHDAAAAAEAGAVVDPAHIHGSAVPVYMHGVAHVLEGLLQQYLGRIELCVDAPMDEEEQGVIGGAEVVVQRKTGAATFGWGFGAGARDGIQGQFTGEAILFTGLGMYGDNVKGNKITIRIEVTEASSGEKLVSSEAEYESTGNGEIIEVLIDDPVQLEPEVNYKFLATVVRRDGGSSYYGNTAGSLTDDEERKWTFTHNPDSVNGTGVTNGQVPAILYQNAVKAGDKTAADGPSASMTMQADNMAAVHAFADFATTVLHHIRHTAIDALYDLVRGNGAGTAAMCYAVALRHPVLTHLLPRLLAASSRVALANAPFAESILGDAEAVTLAMDALMTQGGPRRGPTAVAEHRTVTLESKHPYQPVTTQVWQVDMPQAVQWMVLEFDPQSATVQHADNVMLFLDHAMRLPVGGALSGQAGDAIAAVAKKSIPGNWPSNRIVVPGRHLTVCFTTGTDTSKADNPSRFGFRLTVTGQGVMSPAQYPLQAVESEAAYAAAVCARQAVLPTSAALVVERDATVPASGTHGNWVSVEPEFDSGIVGSVTRDEDGVSVSSTGSGFVTLPFGISAGCVAFETRITRETTSQCLCFGAMTQKAKDSSNAAYQAQGVYCVRIYNGMVYINSRQETKQLPKAFQDNTVRVELDMENHTLTYTVNDGEPNIVTESLPDETMYGSVHFYSSGRSIKLEVVEVSGSAIAEVPGMAAPAKDESATAAPFAALAGLDEPESDRDAQQLVASCTAVLKGGFAAGAPAAGGAGNGVGEGLALSPSLADDEVGAAQGRFLTQFVEASAGTVAQRLSQWLELTSQSSEVIESAAAPAPAAAASDSKEMAMHEEEAPMDIHVDANEAARLDGVAAQLRQQQQQPAQHLDDASSVSSCSSGTSTDSDFESDSEGAAGNFSLFDMFRKADANKAATVTRETRGADRAGRAERKKEKLEQKQAEAAAKLLSDKEALRSRMATSTEAQRRLWRQAFATVLHHLGVIEVLIVCAPMPAL